MISILYHDFQLVFVMPPRSAKGLLDALSGYAKHNAKKEKNANYPTDLHVGSQLLRPIKGVPVSNGKCSVEIYSVAASDQSVESPDLVP